MNKKIAIIGATSAIAEKCSRIWAENGSAEFILVGRNQLKLQSVAQHLRTSYKGVEAEIRVMEFFNPSSIDVLVASLYEHGIVDIALIAHGFLPSQEKCKHDLTYCNESLMLNGLSPVLFLEAFAKKMEQLNHGHIGIIGSVAGDRGRKSNYVYGASKGLIEIYVQGLQHRLARGSVKVSLIKPGPTNTPMTAGIGIPNNSLASVDLVAKDIVAGMEKGKATIYTPKIWRFIMVLISNMPKSIFNKLNMVIRAKRNQSTVVKRA